jgi:hypothetical protein
MSSSFTTQPQSFYEETLYSLRPSPKTKYDMDEHMATLLEVRLGTCVERWAEQKARIDSQHKPYEDICISNNKRPNFNAWSSYYNGFLRLQSWDFCFHLGTWDPCELTLSLSLSLTHIDEILPNLLNTSYHDS